MKKQYFAWKDGTNEVAEIMAKEFLTIYKHNKVLAKGERRYFTRIPGVTGGDVYYFFECTYEDYKKSVAESQVRYRKICEERDLKEKDFGTILSLLTMAMRMIRLIELSELYRIYIPFPMTTEIYSKLYLALLRSLQKKMTKTACNTTESKP